MFLRVCLLLLVCPLVVFGTGCEEAVSPTLSSGAQFTLYGALDPNADRQAIRVFPIRDQIEVGEPGPLGAVFTSTDLQTGEERAWRDSVVAFAGGSGNVFIADFTPEFGRTYKVEVVGDEGLAASAVVDVPPLIEPILRVPTFNAEGAAQEVFWPGAARLNQARITLELISNACDTYTYEVEVGGAAPLDFGWVVEVPFAQIAQGIASDLGVAANRLSILNATVEVDVANQAWVPPSGTFDPEVLIEPGTFSNVANGFGFVGARYPSSIRWQPTSVLASRSGFRPIAFGECP